jgi:hypothetical protein
MTMSGQQPLREIPPSADRRHEPEGTRPRATLVGALLFLASLALVLVLVHGVWRWFHRLEPGRVPGNAPAQLAASPVAPWLNPGDDLAEIRRREDEHLSTYAWIDPHGGLVRIPIARAMDLLVTGRSATAQTQPSAGEK